MQCSIEVTMDNAAFEDEPATELAVILRKLVTRIEAGETDCALFDTNGNRVGRFCVSK